MTKYKITNNNTGKNDLADVLKCRIESKKQKKTKTGAICMGKFHTKNGIESRNTQNA
jgi:hypothetical protein